MGQRRSKGGGRNRRGCEVHCTLKKTEKKETKWSTLKKKKIKLNYKEEKENTRGLMKNIW